MMGHAKQGQIIKCCCRFDLDLIARVFKIVQDCHMKEKSATFERNIRNLNRQVKNDGWLKLGTFRQV